MHRTGWFLLRHHQRGMSNDPTSSRTVQSSGSFAWENWSLGADVMICASTERQPVYPRLRSGYDTFHDVPVYAHTGGTTSPSPERNRSWPGISSFEPYTSSSSPLETAAVMGAAVPDDAAALAFRSPVLVLHAWIVCIAQGVVDQIVDLTLSVCIGGVPPDL